MRARPILALALAAALTAPAAAQDAGPVVPPPPGMDPAPGPAAGDPQAALKQRKQTALTKGVRFLVQQQQADGSWTYANAPFVLDAKFFPMAQGSTALVCYALLKCGVDPADPALQKGFQFIHAQELKHTYAVSCVLLALEARANPQVAPEVSDDKGSSVRKPKRPPPPQDLALARRCVDFIVQHQQPKGLWRYPSGDQEDISNTQYAMLALDAAERMNVPVPREVYEKVAARLLESQEKDGEEVPYFPVPGAEKTFRELKKIQDEMEKEILKLEAKFKKAKDGRDQDGQTLEDRTGTVERGASKKILETGERRTFKSRGWPYMPPGAPGGQDWHKTVTGSMTASGLAAMFICKARLEGQPRYERELKGKIDEALRDGAAWLAKHYTVNQNPGFALHHYYYLYGLERAGILGVIPKFGDHDWYQEGCEQVLAQQRESDGGWHIDSSTAGPVPDSAFALLFLARGTTPVVNVPRRVMTGGGR